MRDKLINFFFKIQETVESNENGTMGITLDVKSRFGHLGIFVWWLLVTIRSKMQND